MLFPQLNVSISLLYKQIILQKKRNNLCCFFNHSWFWGEMLWGLSQLFYLETKVFCSLQQAKTHRCRQTPLLVWKIRPEKCQMRCTTVAKLKDLAMFFLKTCLQLLIAWCQLRLPACILSSFVRFEDHQFFLVRSLNHPLICLYSNIHLC